jgi:hypothetical protein
MVMTRINGRYNLIATDMDAEEFTEELSSLIQTMADDLDNGEDMLYIPNCTCCPINESTASILS